MFEATNEMNSGVDLEAQRYKWITSQQKQFSLFDNVNYLLGIFHTNVKKYILLSQGAPA